MIFHITTVDNRSCLVKAKLFAPIGSNICGLNLQGVRATSITLTKTELLELLKNQKYLQDQVLPSMMFEEETAQARLHKPPKKD